MTNDPDLLSRSNDGRAIGTFPDDAFIFPDEPFVVDGFRSALISPDEPLESGEDEGGVVVGMDGSTRHDAAGTRDVLLPPERIAEILEAVSTDLRENGIAALGAERGSSAFEKNLRTYLEDYLSKFR